MAQPRWKPESREAVVRALEEADSIEAAARALGVATTTLNRYCRDNDVDRSPARSSGGRGNEKFVLTEYALTQVDKSGGIMAIARRLGVTADTLRLAAARAGIDLTPYRSKGGTPAQTCTPLPPDEEVKWEMRLEQSEAKRKVLHAKCEALKTEVRTQREFMAWVLDVAGNPLPPIRLKPLKQDAHKPARSVVVQVSDWQGGQKVSLVDTGHNVYDWDIMLARQQRFLDGVVGSIRNVMRAYHIDEIVLAYTGDILEGYKVFAEQGYQLCRDAGAQVVEGAECWAAFESALCEAFPGIPVRRRMVFGNHGVPEGRKGGAVTSTINYEYVWSNLLEAKTQNLGIESESATHGRILFETAGQSCLLTHGDEIRGQLGIPFYGIRTAWMKHTQEVGLFRYWFFGHIHQTSVVTYGDGAACSCGDAVGYNNLTGKLRNPSSTPQQSVYFLSRQRGLDEISYIHLVEEA